MLKTLSRFSISIFLPVLLSHPSISIAASTRAGNTPQILSYGELMSLSPAKREAYIRGLRRVLVEMAKVSKSEPAALVADRNQRINDALIALLGFIPRAEAASSEADALALSEIAPRFGEPDEPSAPICDESRGIMARAVAGGAWGCFMDRESSDKCSPGFVAVNQDPNTGKFLCQTSASFWMLPKAAKEQARKTTSKNAQMNNLFEQAAIPPPCPSGTTLREVPSDRDRDVASPFVCVNPTATSSKCDAGFVGVLQEKDGKFLCATKSSVNRLSRRQRTMAMAENWSASEDAAAQLRDSDGDVPGGEKKIAGDASGAGHCAPVDLSCEVPKSKKERDDARKKFLASSSSQKCIYAGNINRYQRTAKGASCSPSRVWEVVPGSSKVASRKNTYFWQCDSQQVICNPLLFGVRKESREPFCVSSRSTNVGGRSVGPTEACDLQSTNESRAPDFLDLKEPSGMHDTWLQFKKDFDSLCDNSKESVAFHCAECKVLAKRLPEINYQAVGSCDAANSGGSSQPAPASKKGPGKI